MFAFTFSCCVLLAGLKMAFVFSGRVWFWLQITFQKKKKNSYNSDFCANRNLK